MHIRSGTLTVDALKNTHVGPVSFELPRGDCLSIMGPSGAGKSVLLRLIADLDPHEGRVTLNGVDRATISPTEWRRQVGLVPAVPGWWAPKVIDHFEGVPLDELRRLCDALRLVPHIIDRDIQGLSTGERQRLALMRAMLAEPAVLLLDEPTSGLDAESVAAVEACLRARQSAGTCIVLVTHDIRQAERLAQAHLRLDGGVLWPA